MKKAGKICSGICIAIIITIHLIQALKPFEWQRYDPDPVETYHALQRLSETHRSPFETMNHRSAFNDDFFKKPFPQ